jgi:hypothetical protein
VPVGRIATAAAVLIAVIFAGCSAKGNDSAPAACLSTSDAYVKALAAAPGPVKLEGSTPISDCLVAGQDAGELATIGSTMVKVATDLNEQALTDPSGAAAVELGYLEGAARKGASRTAGIHTDLIRRLNAAARFSPGALPPEFERGYRRGFAAGRAGG